jgi:hypothetical protein
VGTVAIVGQVFDEVDAVAAGRLEVISLVERFGDERARLGTLACIEEAALDVLRVRAERRPLGG